MIEINEARAMVSKIWPDWYLNELVGCGTYGSVFLAYSISTGILCAVKVIQIPENRNILMQMINDKGMQYTMETCRSIKDKFTNEISTLVALQGNENIVNVDAYSVFPTSDNIGWNIIIRMEYLNVLENTNYGFDENSTIRLGIDILNALEKCEGEHIIHRDIKPSNILVDQKGTYKLCDFGIAKNMSENSWGEMTSNIGTPLFMAPEVALPNKKYDHRADIYSLGLVLYKMANRGKPPFVDPDKQILGPNDNKESMTRRMAGEPLPRPATASDELSEIILRACEFQPENRYNSASQMRRDLERLLYGEWQEESIGYESLPQQHGDFSIILAAAIAVGSVLLIAILLILL